MWKDLLVSVLFLGGCVATSADTRFNDGFVDKLFTAPDDQTAAVNIDVKAYCSFARDALGMPVRVSQKLRSEAYASNFTKAKTLQLLWPVARANAAFYCLCGTPDERKRVTCS